MLQNFFEKPLRNYNFKLASIIEMTNSIIELNDENVEFEIDSFLRTGLTNYKLDNIEIKDDTIYFLLQNKQANCLAPDKCGITNIVNLKV